MTARSGRGPRTLPDTLRDRPGAGGRRPRPGRRGRSRRVRRTRRPAGGLGRPGPATGGSRRGPSPGGPAPRRPARDHRAQPGAAARCGRARPPRSATAGAGDRAQRPAAGRPGQDRGLGRPRGAAGRDTGPGQRLRADTVRVPGGARTGPRPAGARRPGGPRRPPRPPRWFRMPRGESGRRVGLTLLAITIVLTLFAGRLVQIQGLESGYYKLKANSEKLTTTYIPAPRGTIYGCGRPAAGDDHREVHGHRRPAADPRGRKPAVAAKLGAAIGLPAVNVLNLLNHPTSRRLRHDRGRRVGHRRGQAGRARPARHHLDSRSSAGPTPTAARPPTSSATATSTPRA